MKVLLADDDPTSRAVVAVWIEEMLEGLAGYPGMDAFYSIGK